MNEDNWTDASPGELEAAAGGQQYATLPPRVQRTIRQRYQRGGAIWGGLAGFWTRTGMVQGAIEGWRLGGAEYDRIHGPIRN